MKKKIVIVSIISTFAICVILLSIHIGRRICIIQKIEKDAEAAKRISIIPMKIESHKLNKEDMQNYSIGYAEFSFPSTTRLDFSTRKVSPIIHVESSEFMVFFLPPFDPFDEVAVFKQKVNFIAGKSCDY